MDMMVWSCMFFDQSDGVSIGKCNHLCSLEQYLGSCRLVLLLVSAVCFCV